MLNADWHTLKHLDEIGIRSVITGRKLAEGTLVLAIITLGVMFLLAMIFD